MERPRAPIDYASLIPELVGLEGGPRAVEVWLANIGRYDVAAAYASLFWPEFTAVDGCVLIGRSIPEPYADWRREHPDDPAAIEAVLNHHHILDLFPVAADPSPQLVRHLGTVLKEMWTAKLRQDFPGRAFVVSFPDDFDLEVDNPEITFYTKRASPDC